MLYDLIQTEGLCLGTSSALNIVGAMKMARDLGPGKTIVTMLCGLWQPLRLEDLQSGLPQGKGPADAGVDSRGDGVVRPSHDISVQLGDLLLHFSPPGGEKVARSAG